MSANLIETETLPAQMSRKLRELINAGSYTEAYELVNESLREVIRTPGNGDKAQFFMLSAAAAYRCEHTRDGDRFSNMMASSVRKDRELCVSLNQQLCALVAVAA